MFDLYPRNSHRTPQQIAEDAGGSFEPRKASQSKADARMDEAARTNSTGDASGGVTKISKAGR